MVGTSGLRAILRVDRSLEVEDGGGRATGRPISPVPKSQPASRPGLSPGRISRVGWSRTVRISWAARYPLRTAPSIVAGQPVSVQSPARNRPSIGVRCGGRSASTPGRTANVAPCSVTTHHRRQFRRSSRGPDLRQLGQHRVADRDLVERQQVVGGTDDQLQVLALRLATARASAADSAA